MALKRSRKAGRTVLARLGRTLQNPVGFKRILVADGHKSREHHLLRLVILLLSSLKTKVLLIPLQNLLA
jgi:hypothetical protein